MEHILYVNILRDNVYIEYTTREFEYISFEILQRKIAELQPESFIFSCSLGANSFAVLHRLLEHYSIKGNQLFRKMEL